MRTIDEIRFKAILDRNTAKEVLESLSGILRVKCHLLDELYYDLVFMQPELSSCIAEGIRKKEAS